MTLTHWAILPVKETHLAKERLGEALGSLRAQFARELALRTLEVVRASGLYHGLVVVTSDRAVRAACRSADTRVLDDDGLGLNDACTRGLLVAATHGANLASIIHSDIATLDVATLQDIVRRFLAVRAEKGAAAVGLVRCKDGSGTNMVLLDPAAPFTPRFGRDSFRAHLRQAGANAHELAGGEAAFDIDTPEDLDRLLERTPAAGWLQRYAGARRPASPSGERLIAAAERRRPEGEDFGFAVPQ